MSLNPVSTGSKLPDNHQQLWENRSFYDEANDTWWSVEGSGKPKKLIQEGHTVYTVARRQI